VTRVRVLFCDDSAGVVKGFEKNVAAPLQGIIDAVTASSVQGVERLIGAGKAFDVVVTDLNFEKVGGGPKDGLEIIRLARGHWPSVESILMTAYEGSLDVRDGQRLATMGVGEGSLLAKAASENPGMTWLRLRERIQGLSSGGRGERTALRRENRFLREALGEDTVAWVAERDLDQAAQSIRADEQMVFAGQVGRSFVMQEVFRRTARAASLPSDVLILGATGTGKELVARAVHAGSSRSAQPFVKADLTTTSDRLLESELFGYEKGAFTGADARKAGLLSTADGGTFFLDEIGNVAAETQAKLLRVLDDRVYRPLGGNKEIKADVRIVAATHVDLAEAVERGAFRADLYERLNVVRISLPTLAERREDVPLLVALFIDEYRAAFGVSGLRRIERSALLRLVDQPWTRNVRQLKHAIERLFAEVEPGETVICDEHVESVIENAPMAGGEAVQASNVFQSILAGRMSLSLAELKKKFGEDIVREVVRQTMIHFRGLPDGEECAQYFGGTSPNAWRQFAFQLGVTWKTVRRPN